jgi:hypothetical protein
LHITIICTQSHVIGCQATFGWLPKLDSNSNLQPPSLHSSCTMGSFGFEPHSCEYCPKLEIEGISSNIELTLEYTFCRVERLAEHCDFFKWTLRYQTTFINVPDKLILYISQDSEDLQCLNIDWKNVHGLSMLPESSERRTLHIFTTKGILS